MVQGMISTIKYNTFGVQQWTQRYSGPGNQQDWGKSIAVDASGYVYVTGNSRGSDGIYDYATVKYNSLGVQQWAVRYNGAGIVMISHILLKLIIQEIFMFREQAWGAIKRWLCNNKV